MKSKKSKARCREHGRKFTKYSPGCGGPVDNPSTISEVVRTTKFGRWVSKPIPGKTCRLHYLENAFGIYALKCPVCHDTIQEKTAMHMMDDERYTYIELEAMLAHARWGWWTRHMAFDIRCWHCGYVFQRKSHWSPTRDYVERYVQAFAWMDSDERFMTITPDQVRENSHPKVHEPLKGPRRRIL